MAKTKQTANTGVNKMTSLGKSEAGRVVLFRALIIILADIILASLFDFVKSDAARELAFHQHVHPVLKYAFGAVFVMSVAYLVFALVRKLDTSAHPITPLMTVGLGLFLFISAILYDHFRNTPFLFYTIMIVGSVLYIVYYIYTILLYKK